MAKVLIACEFTGTMREAFSKDGHDVMSCDLLASEMGGGKHYQGSVLDILNRDWDLMIGHPPCTYLSFAGKRYWDQPGRAKQRLEALDFFLQLWEAPIKYICLENPLGIVDQVIQKHHQLVHPYYFGDSYLKRTCLWLKNLPQLKFALQDNLFTQRTATDYPKPMYIDKNGKQRHFTEGSSGGHNRSKSFKGVARAMAEQWTPIINKSQ